ncbi:MAG: hypothetical protein WCP33_01925, partial [Deltaproteobacteria bacterium]
MQIKLLFMILLMAIAVAMPVMAEDMLQVPNTNSTSTLVTPSDVKVETVPTTSPKKEDQKKAAAELVWEFDPYYSDVSLHIPLTDKPIPEMTGNNEFQVYRKLFVDSLVPKFMLIEAAVFPMPLLGVTAKRYAPDFYRGFNVGSGDLNMLDAITAGFQEPYALSIFFGDMVNFVRPGEEKVSTNKGYMGYMVSYSNEHIKHNVLIPDHNIEAEWKMKGEKVFKDDKLSWSFRLGAKVHQNPEITNTFYLGLRRNQLDFKANFLSFLNNSDLDFRWDFSAKDGRPLRQEYVIGKKYPINRWHIA